MKRIRITWLDLITVLFLLIAGITVLYRAKVGLHYSWNWSAIPQYLFRYDEMGQRWVPNLLVEGLLTTLRLSIWGTFFATLIGIVIALFRVSPTLFKRLLGRTYVELIRNMPPLVLIFIFYFFISDQIMRAIGLDGFMESLSEGARSVLSFLFAPPPLFPSFLSALIALSLFEGAFMAEIMRAGIESIEKGQWEASYALGFSRWQQMRFVILPQATRRIIPPLAGQLISTVKDSAIVSVISIQELTFQGMELMSSTFLRFEVWITITLLYLILTLTLSLAVGRLEVHLRKKEF
ncbi:MAG: amino acid ABC transporter permease [Pseudomonadota bacterium]